MDTEVTDTHMLKLEIKNWEYNFRREHLRDPTKEDIKQDVVVAAKYKQYRSLTKSNELGRKKFHEEIVTLQKISAEAGRSSRQLKGETSLSTTPQQPLRTPTKKSSKYIYDTPSKVNSVTKSSNLRYFSTDVLGPTPLAEGRILGILDIASTSSPLSTNSHIASPLQKEEESTAPSTPESKRLLHIKTPQTLTPSYFKPTTETCLTPSPLRNRRVSRGLTAILAELKQIQDNAFEEDEKVLQEMEATAVENPYHLGEVKEKDFSHFEAALNENHLKAFQPKKTQKRTTRHYKMKPAPMSVMPVTIESSNQHSPSDSDSDSNSEIDINSRTEPKAESSGPHDNSTTSESDTLSIQSLNGAHTSSSGRITKSRPVKVSANFRKLKLRNRGNKGKSQFYTRRKR
ncbi:DNA replication/checkpoint protein [Dipodascopsis uninucleata]